MRLHHRSASSPEITERTESAKGCTVVRERSLRISFSGGIREEIRRMPIGSIPQGEMGLVAEILAFDWVEAARERPQQQGRPNTEVVHSVLPRQITILARMQRK